MPDRHDDPVTDARTNTPTHTRADRLGDLVTATPAAARVFERYGLDYCCGGEMPLDDACAAAGVDPEAVIRDLDALAPAPLAPWASMGPAELVDHLVDTHHAYLHTELTRLLSLADKVAAVHRARHPELLEVQRTVQVLQDDLEPHMHKEEHVLFPMIRVLAAAPPGEAPTFHCGSLRNPISVMLLEHDRTGEILDHLRTITGGYTVPDDACASYRGLYQGLHDVEIDTHLHVHKENNVLFPAVVALEQPSIPA